MVNATKAVSARQRAREASLKFYEREKEREAVQLQYFQAMESVDRVHAQRDRELEVVRVRAEQAASAAVRTADEAIVSLLELRVTRSEIQERLGCAPADIRRAEATASVSTPDTDGTGADAAEGGAGVVEFAPAEPAPGDAGLDDAAETAEMSAASTSSE